MTISDEEREMWQGAAERAAAERTQQLIAAFGPDHKVGPAGRAALRHITYAMSNRVIEALIAEIKAARLSELEGLARHFERAPKGAPVVPGPSNDFAEAVRRYAADAVREFADREDSDQDQQQPKTMGDLQEGDIVTSRLGKRVWHHTVLRTAPGPYGVVTIYFSDTFHWVVPVQQSVEARRPAISESEHANG